MQFSEYDWIFGLTVVFAFATAVGIGANDISNSFATSVASRALSLSQVVILGGICEVGPVLLENALLFSETHHFPSPRACRTDPAFSHLVNACSFASCIWSHPNTAIRTETIID